MDILHYYIHNIKKFLAFILCYNYLYNTISTQEGKYMSEIEIKVLGVDVDEVKRKVLSLGGVLVKNENQENHIYNLPSECGDVFGYVRIRSVHSLLDDSRRIILGVKKIISQEKSRVMEEHEMEVEDLDECIGFLKTMCIKHYRTENKYRESYKFNDTLIEFDTWDKSVFPHPYIEIESKYEGKIFETLKLLGIPEEKTTSKNLKQLREEMGLA
jgi:adenylate cyclase class 2